MFAGCHMTLLITRTNHNTIDVYVRVIRTDYHAGQISIPHRLVGLAQIAAGVRLNRRLRGLPPNSPIPCGMKMCPAWSAVRKTSNINIDGPASPTFAARTDYHTTYV